jgi:hypothetical protein
MPKWPSKLRVNTTVDAVGFPCLTESDCVWVNTLQPISLCNQNHTFCIMLSIAPQETHARWKHPCLCLQCKWALWAFVPLHTQILGFTRPLEKEVCNSKCHLSLSWLHCASLGLEVADQNIIMVARVRVKSNPTMPISLAAGMCA